LYELNCAAPVFIMYFLTVQYSWSFFFT